MMAAWIYLFLIILAGAGLWLTSDVGQLGALAAPDAVFITLSLGIAAFTFATLVNGRAPSTLNFVVNLNGAHVTFSFDPSAGTLAWDAVSTTPLVASVHRGRNGPALATLMTNTASESAGIVVLSLADRETLRASGLFLAVRTMAQPQQVERAPIRVAQP